MNEEQKRDAIDSAVFSGTCILYAIASVIQYMNHNICLAIFNGIMAGLHQGFSVFFMIKVIIKNK